MYFIASVSGVILNSVGRCVAMFSTCVFCRCPVPFALPPKGSTTLFANVLLCATVFGIAGGVRGTVVGRLGASRKINELINELSAQLVNGLIT